MVDGGCIVLRGHCAQLTRLSTASVSGFSHCHADVNCRYQDTR